MEKYIQYDAFLFSEDPDFIKWVQSDFQYQSSKWETFQSKNVNLEGEINEAIEIVQLFNFENDDVDSSRKQNLLNRINETIVSENDSKIKQPHQTKNTTTAPPAEKKSIIRYLIPLAAAACLAAVLFMRTGGPTIMEHATEIAETTQVTLPDESTVELNAGSLLSYDGNNFKEARQLKLHGEAFFNVEKGQQFVVDTKNGTIEVLGTSFNVFVRGSQLKVECLTGKVRVKNKSKSEEVILTPNEKCTLTKAKKLVKTSIKEKQSDWRNGVYHFEGVKLSEVLREIERQFDVSVTCSDAIAKKTYTGFFEKKNLKDALHLVTWPLGLEAISQDGKIIIVKKE